MGPRSRLTAASTQVFNLFSGIFNKGSDPDVSHDHGAIGYAQGLNGLVNVHASFGADGAAVNQAEVFSLTLSANGDRFRRCIRPTAQKIYLLTRTASSSGASTPITTSPRTTSRNHFVNFDHNDPDDAAAFAITIDPATGKVYVAQYLSLEHFSSPDASGDISEADSLASGTLSVSVTVTDGDGDSVTKAADVSGEIKFLDDGPTVTVSVDHHFSVVLDETPGVQSEDDDTTSSSVRHLFDSVDQHRQRPRRVVE